MENIDDCRWLVAWDSYCECRVKNETSADVTTMQKKFCRDCIEYTSCDNMENYDHLDA